MGSSCCNCLYIRTVVAMARINFKFGLLVAFLVTFIGQGLVTDAKPIDKKDVLTASEVAPKEEDIADASDEAVVEENEEPDVSKDDGVVNAGDRRDVLLKTNDEEEADAEDEAEDVASGKQDEDDSDVGSEEGSGDSEVGNKKCCCHCCHHCCHHCHHCCHHSHHCCHHCHHCHHCCCGKKTNVVGVGGVSVPVALKGNGCGCGCQHTPAVHHTPVIVHTKPACGCGFQAAPVDHTPCSTTETVHHVPLKVQVSVGKPAAVAHKTTQNCGCCGNNSVGVPASTGVIGGIAGTNGK